jgi:invasion protein IalB
MTTFSSRVVAIAFASALFTGSALAQTAAPAQAPADTSAPAAKAAKPHSAASIECSKEADAKGLHGKDRKKFRSQCRSDAMKKGDAK